MRAEKLKLLHFQEVFNKLFASDKEVKQLGTVFQMGPLDSIESNTPSEGTVKVKVIPIEKKIASNSNERAKKLEPSSGMMKKAPFHTTTSKSMGSMAKKQLMYKRKMTINMNQMAMLKRLIFVYLLMISAGLMRHFIEKNIMNKISNLSYIFTYTITIYGYFSTYEVAALSLIFWGPQNEPIKIKDPSLKANAFNQTTWISTEKPEQEKKFKERSSSRFKFLAKNPSSNLYLYQQSPPMKFGSLSDAIKDIDSNLKKTIFENLQKFLRAHNEKEVLHFKKILNKEVKHIFEEVEVNEFDILNLEESIGGLLEKSIGKFVIGYTTILEQMVQESNMHSSTQKRKELLERDEYSSLVALSIINLGGTQELMFKHLIRPLIIEFNQVIKSIKPTMILLLYTGRVILILAFYLSVKTLFSFMVPAQRAFCHLIYCLPVSLIESNTYLFHRLKNHNRGRLYFTI